MSSLHHFLLLFLLFTPITFIFCYNNGIPKATPAMGWNSWNTFACNINETLILQTIDSIIHSGLLNLGYDHVVIDDCWAAMERDPKTRRMVPDPVRFPHGIQPIAAYANRRGVKLGIYSDVGKRTCQGRPGSFEHYDVDAQTFAEWGISYLKLDFCHLSIGEVFDPARYYTEMSKELNKTGQPILFSICNWGYDDPSRWAPAIANMWRIAMDIKPVYPWIMHIVSVMNGIADRAGPYGWNDPDSLEVGVNFTSSGLTSLTPNECRAHFMLWCVLSAPLVLGNDVNNMPPWVYQIISNKDLISINQDSHMVQGKLVQVDQENTLDGFCVSLPGYYCKYTELYVKPLSQGRFAVIMFNRGDSEIRDDSRYRSETMTVNWVKHLGVNAKTVYSVRNMWNSNELGTFTGTFSSEVKIDPRDAAAYLLTPN